MYKKMRGFTLMELMIVVVVVGILASLAYPNYRAYVARAKRNEAKAALLQIATNQERFYLNANAYTPNLADVGVTTPTASGTYTIVMGPANANTFSATATYVPSDDEASKCLTFTIDASGNRTSSPYLDCWTRTR